MPTDRWMDKEDVRYMYILHSIVYIYTLFGHKYMHVCVCVCVCVYVYNGILFGHKKNEMPFAGTWMDLQIIMLSEVGQTRKGKYYMISLTCEIFKKWYKWSYL